jgi:hypothetical protein
VQKVADALESGRTLRAAARRDVLVLRLAPVLAVHHRLLDGSEDAFRHRLGVRIGPEWMEAQAVAFAIGGESLEASCGAALRLYRIAAESVGALLGERQRGVVDHALAIAAAYEPA